MNKSNHNLCAIDVGKYELVIAQNDMNKTLSIENTMASIKPWINSLKPNSQVIMESTGTYHLLVAELLIKAGHQVFLVNGYQLSQYRKSVGQRAKTDISDAKLLLRYLINEYDMLKPWQPINPNIRKIRQLLRKRATLVSLKKSLLQSLSDLEEIDSKVAVASIESTINKLNKLMASLIQSDDRLNDAAQRCQQITGVGVLTATALTSSFYRGNFRNADAFVAYQGLDLVAKDSGTKKGIRKLSKQGDSEVRRLLHNAAMSACRVGHWKAYYESYLARGLARTQALVILARKIVRVAFCLLKTGTNFDPVRAFPSS